MPGCATSFRMLWIQMSERMWTFHFPDCTTDFSYWHTIGIGGKGGYLYMVSTTSFRIVLVMVVVNKMYKNEPRESSSTSCSESSTSSGGSEDSAVFFFAGLFVALLLARGALTGLSCVFAGLSWVFFFQKGSSACKNKQKAIRKMLKRRRIRKQKDKFLPLAVCWRHKRDTTQSWCTQKSVHLASFWQTQWPRH